jgi:hypothetical protein
MQSTHLILLDKANGLYYGLSIEANITNKPEDHALANAAGSIYNALLDKRGTGVASITREKDKAKALYDSLTAVANVRQRESYIDRATHAGQIYFYLREMEIEAIRKANQAALLQDMETEKNERATIAARPTTRPTATPTSENEATVDKAAVDQAAVNQANYNFNIGAIVFFMFIILLIGMFFMFLQNKKPDNPYIQPMQPM